LEKKKKVHFHTISLNVKRIEVPMKRGKGRPHNGEKPQTDEGWVIELSFTLDSGKVEEKRKSESRYVLASSVLDKEKLPDDKLLKVYKGQSGVESNFNGYICDKLFHRRSDS
jgi:hypothetical protein